VETLARLEGHVVKAPAGSSSINRTLDSHQKTFPPHQTLYFDFSHDHQIINILTAFGLRQFATFLPPTGPPHERQLIISHLTPYAARLVIEVITAPRPISSRRPQDTPDQSGAYNDTAPAKETTYIHFLLNQRTIPLGKSFPECGDRDDGWCELDIFLDLQKDSIDRARYEYSCFANYTKVPYGEVRDGVPVT
jgi:hypothetical protein